MRKSKRKVLNRLERGGKRSATALWMSGAEEIQSAVAASLCRRTPKVADQ